MVGFSTVAAIGLGAAGIATSIRGQNKAAKAAETAATNTDATTRYIYDDTVRRNQFRENMGNSALSQLGGMYGLNNTAQQFGGGGFTGFGGGAGSGFGAGIGRAQGGGFSPAAYLDANPNLASTYRPGLDGFNDIYSWANAHWNTHGQNEGRPSGQGFGSLPNVGLNTEEGAAGAAGAANPFQAFYDSPDYQLAFDEGQQALEGSAAARGGLLSGATGKALVDYGQNRANTMFGNYKNTLNNMAGLGQQANNAISNAGQNYASQFGSNQAMIAQAQGNAAVGTGNAIGGALTGLATGILRPSGQEVITNQGAFL